MKEIKNIQFNTDFYIKLLRNGINELKLEFYEYEKIGMGKSLDSILDNFETLVEDTIKTKLDEQKKGYKQWLIEEGYELLVEKL